MGFRKAALWTLGLLALGVYVYRVRSALLGMAAVFGFAAAFTLLLLPVCRMLERRGVKPTLAAAGAVAGFLLIALLIVSAFVPYLVTHTVHLIRRNAPTVSALMQQLDALLEQTGMQGARRLGTGDAMAVAVSRLTAFAARGGMALAAQTGRILFALVLSYYLLCERNLIGNHLLLFVPPLWRTAVLSTINGCKNALMGYLSGMLKTSAFVGLATYLGLLILGVEDALLLALFMGVFEILPYIGPVLAAVPILLSSMPQGMNQTLLVLALVVLVQQVEGNFISPYFTASSTSIHPLIALLSVFALGSLTGVWGVLLAVPLVVTLRSAFWSLRQARQATRAGRAQSIICSSRD